MLWNIDFRLNSYVKSMLILCLVTSNHGPSDLFMTKFRLNSDYNFKHRKTLK